MNKQNKIKRKLTVFLMMMTLVNFLLAVTTTSATTITTYVEDFGSPDADGANPYSDTGEIPYAYSEFGWGAGVNTTLDTSPRFYVNSSTTGVDGASNFTFNSTKTYDYLLFSFKYLNSWTAWENHSGVSFILQGSLSAIFALQVYGANNTVTNQSNRMLLLDHAGNIVKNVSCAANTWYAVTIHPHYESWKNTIEITVETATAHIIHETIDLNSNTGMSALQLNDVSTGKTCVLVGTIVASDYVYTQGEQTVNYLSTYIMPIIFAIGIFMTIATMAVTGNLTPESLVGIAVIAIIGTIGLGILTAL